MVVHVVLVDSSKKSRVFESVIIVIFQSVFHSEKCTNNIFLFFKNHFLDQHIKKILNFFGSAFENHSQTGIYV